MVYMEFYILFLSQLTTQQKEGWIDGAWIDP